MGKDILVVNYKFPVPPKSSVGWASHMFTFENVLDFIPPVVSWMKQF